MPTPVCARGGVYVDDLVLKNNGTVVYSEDFDSADLSGWYSITDASVSSDHYSSAGYSLYENSYGGAFAKVSTDVLVSNPGLLELSFRVWLPEASEQWNSGNGSNITSLNVILHSDTNQSYSSGLWLYPNESEYRMALNGQHANTPTCSGGVWQTLWSSLIRTT
jgi:hypothetical protein